MSKKWEFRVFSRRGVPLISLKAHLAQFQVEIFSNAFCTAIRKLGSVDGSFWKLSVCSH